MVDQRTLARRAEQLPARNVTEAQYQAWIVKHARRQGWSLQFHVLRARVKEGRWVTNTSNPGVPDLWLLRPETGQLVVLEVKKERDGTSEQRRRQQERWVAGLQQVPGVESYIVRPSDAAEVLALLAWPYRATPKPATVPPHPNPAGAAS